MTSLCIEQLEGYMLNSNVPYALSGDANELLVPATTAPGLALIRIAVGPCGTSLVLRILRKTRTPFTAGCHTIRLPSELRDHPYTVELRAANHFLELTMRVPAQENHHSISPYELHESMAAISFALTLSKQLLSRDEKRSREEGGSADPTNNSDLG